MIFPFLNGLFIPFRRAPVTWILVWMNVVVFALFFSSQQSAQDKMSSFFDKDQFVLTQGTLFAQYIRSHREIHSSVLQKLSDNVLSTGSLDRTRLLGQIAFRDAGFMTGGTTEPYSGDEVAIERWRKDVRSIASIQEKHVSYRLGVSPMNAGWASWISYQFVHGNHMHILTNMVFLIMIGGALESLIGPVAILVIYLLSGIVGAGAFLMLSGLSAVPLVGASGSVSGLMGAYVGVNWKKSVRFFYLLMPAQGYWGYLYLPSWVALGFWMISDVAGYFGTLAETGGVAHATHLGGIVFGLLCGWLVVQLPVFRRHSTT